MSYIDPDTHTLRNYYPDFLIKDKNGTYRIEEIKADYMIDKSKGRICKATGGF